MTREDASPAASSSTGPATDHPDATEALVARLLRDRVVARAWPVPAEEPASDAQRRFDRLAASGDWSGAFRTACAGLAAPSGDVALRRAAIAAALSAPDNGAVRAGLDALVAGGAADPVACAIHLVACTTGAQTFEARRASPLAWANALMWAVDKVDPALLERMLQPLLPLVGRWPMFGDLVEILARMPAARPDDAFLDHTHAALQLAPSGRSTALLVGFCGGGGRIGLPINMFHRWAGGCGAHVLYLRVDLPGSYDQGIPECGPGYTAMAALVRALAAALAVDHIGVYGNSSGAFPAAKLGLRLDARRIVVAAGATHAEAGETRRAVAGAPSDTARPAMARDLEESIARSRGGSEILCIHAEGNGHDRGNAEAIANLPGVRVMSVAGHQHNVARQLVLTDAFAAVLAWAAGRGPLPATVR